MIRRQGPILTLMACALVMFGAVGVAAPVRAAMLVNPVAEAQNLRVSQEREAQFDSPSMLAQVAAATSAYQKQRFALTVTDPGRQPNPNSCTTGVACSIDPRLEHWTDHGGIVKPVLFTARSGATLSGHVWATKAGAGHRPTILIVNGSVVGYEQIYWYAAQALARDGYVVLTFDVQGEGMSDQFGAAPDQQEGAYAGTPVLGPQLGGGGLPFYDGGEDALNFLLSTPAHPYVPIASRSTGTSHAAKQEARVKAGLDSAYDPLWALIDRKEIGVAGHSYGAEAASWLGQSDRRIKAVVAWDNLCVPIWPSPTEAVALAHAPQNLQPLGFFGLPTDCFGAPAGPTPRLHAPALGLSSDYLLTPEPYTVVPRPDLKQLGSLAYTRAGVDTGEIVIRGGTHYEFADAPTGAIPASRRGIDLVTWYTLAWFDRYLKTEASADARLFTTRWRSDEIGGSVDPTHDPNLFSSHYRSRLDVHLLGGGTFDCEDLRAGCTGQVMPDADRGPRSFSYLAVDTGESPPVVRSVRRPSTR